MFVGTPIPFFLRYYLPEMNVIYSTANFSPSFYHHPSSTFFWPIKIQFLFFPPTSRKTGRPGAFTRNNMKTRSKSAGPSTSRNGQPSYRSSSPSSSCTRGSNNVWLESFAIYFIRENFPLSSVTGLLNCLSVRDQNVVNLYDNL